jgi:hypothetical protein
MENKMTQLKKYINEWKEKYEVVHCLRKQCTPPNVLIVLIIVLFM